MAEGKFMRLNFEMFSTSLIRAGRADLSSARAASCSAPVVAEMRTHSSLTRSSKGEGTTVQGWQKSKDRALQIYPYGVGIRLKGFCQTVLRLFRCLQQGCFSHSAFC